MPKTYVKENLQFLVTKLICLDKSIKHLHKRIKNLVLGKGK